MNSYFDRQVKIYLKYIVQIRNRKVTDMNDVTTDKNETNRSLMIIFHPGFT